MDYRVKLEEDKDDRTSFQAEKQLTIFDVRPRLVKLRRELARRPDPARRMRVRELDWSPGPASNCTGIITGEYQGVYLLADLPDRPKIDQHYPINAEKVSFKADRMHAGT